MLKTQLRKRMSEIQLHIIYEEGVVDEPWSHFMEDMFTIDLPDSCRDLGLEVTRLSLSTLLEFNMKNLCNSWKLFVFSETMLKTFKNKESILHQSNILKSNPDFNIFLILDNEEDTEFISEVRQIICVCLGFAKHHEVHTTDSEKIFNDIMELISPMNLVLHPNTMSCEDKSQHLTVVGNKPFPVLSDGQSFLIELVDELNTVEVEANLFNPYTLLFQNPGHGPGIISVNVYVTREINSKLERSQLGDSVKAWFQSDLDKVNALMEKNSRPFEFLAQALKLNPNDEFISEKIDNVLADSFRKQVPESKLAVVFGCDQGTTEDENQRRREFSPTLLHFAAMHGLNNLTAMLLRCPGAIMAYGTANCDGDYPTNLAEKYGHWDLRDYMQGYMEVSAMVDSEMEGKVMTSRAMSEMVTGLYDVDSLYEVHETGSVPGYLSMKPKSISSSNEIYDSPFVHPIPLAHTELNVDDSVLKHVLEGTEESVYISLNVDLLTGVENPYMSMNEIPPIPPRDDISTSPRYSGLPPRPVHPLSPLEGKERRTGADRKSYDSIKIPKMINHVATAQHELIFLQQRVKCGELTTNQALARFKEWERKHKEQPASFQYQQESLQRIRDSLNKRKEEKRLKGESYQIEITAPIVAGSSTYDKVLRKTSGPHGINVEEACYGVTENTMSNLMEKPPHRPRLSISSSLGEGSSPINNDVMFTERHSHVFNDGFSNECKRNNHPQKFMTENAYSSHRKANHYSTNPVLQPPPVPPRNCNH